MSTMHLAQLNIAQARAPLDDPQMADLVARLGEINHLAEQSPGFVWRLTRAGGDATHTEAGGQGAFDDPRAIINISLWTDIESLFDYVYRSRQAEVFSPHQGCIEPGSTARLVLWWQPVGALPTLAEAERRLALLTAEGPTAEAFTFNRRFPCPTPNGKVARLG